MLCAEVPYVADQIVAWSKESGVHGSEFGQVVAWSVEYERRRILTNGLPVIVDLLQKGEQSDSIVRMLHDAITEVSSGKDITSIGSFDFRAWYEAEEKGPMWYVEPLDWIVGGMVAGSLAVIGGFTGSLKTTFAINVLYNAVVNLRYNAVFYSFEMTREQLLIRLIVRHSQHKRFRKECMDITVSKVMERKLSMNEEEFLFNKVQPDLFENLSYGHLIIREAVDLRELSLRAIEEDLGEVNAKCGAFL